MVKQDTAIKAALKLKKCKAKIRKAGQRVICDTEYLGEVCPKKEYHLLKGKTGFCANGWCEGSKAKDWKGNPVPTCKFIFTCPCICHDALDKLFSLTESERVVVDSSGYAPPHRTYWMPSDDPLPPLSNNGHTSPPVVVESPAPDRVPATVIRTFTPTPTGRAARGELELWVKQQCDEWLIDEPGEPCTLAYLAAEISRTQGITSPSVGAISAVFDRWAKLGFAIIEKKPTRFVKYTDEGVRLGLEQMKTQAKRAAKQKRSNQLRGFR